MKSTRTAGIVFSDEHTKAYDFLTDHDIHPNDLVVVPTPYHSTGFTVGRVKYVREMVVPHATKWIVQRVDLHERDLSVGKEHQLRTLYGKMKKRRHELGLKMSNRQAADHDDEMSRLFVQAAGLREQLGHNQRQEEVKRS